MHMHIQEKALVQKAALSLLLGAITLLCAPAQAQDQASPSKAADDGAEGAESEYQDNGWTDPTVYSEKEKAATCRKYNNKYLSYYDSVYQVKNCEFREIQSAEMILKLNKDRVNFVVIEGEVLAKLKRGAPITDEVKPGTKRTQRGCKALEGKYITYAYTDVYLVQKCKKRVFEEWSSFVEHRKKNNRQRDEVLALTYPEFWGIAVGDPMPSYVDSEFKRLKIMSHDADVIPLNEACKGLNGKDVSYVDRIYRIEACKKREYNVADYLKKRRDSRLALKELSSEQWLSLPDGKPMPGPKEMKPPK